MPFPSKIFQSSEVRHLVYFRCGYTKSTNVQHEAIPNLLEYSDCHALIASETGNGKTLAMAVPLIQVIMTFDP